MGVGQIEPSMPEEGGPFSFDLTRRNAYLEKRGVKGPGFTKTGTTIAGVIFKVDATVACWLCLASADALGSRC